MTSRLERTDGIDGADEAAGVEGTRRPDRACEVEVRKEIDLNPDWTRSDRGHRVTVANEPLLTPSTRIFTIGSCFAMEIREALALRGYSVYPRYRDIEFDTRRQKIGTLPERDGVNHYDTFTIRQELSRAIEGRHFDASDFWTVEGEDVDKYFGTRVVHRDPYRKRVYATSEAGLLELSRRIDATVRAGLFEADVYVLTLGLTEVWRDRHSGYYICQVPHRGHGQVFERAEFHSSTFAENCDNLRHILALLEHQFPEKHVIVSVSPVALARTFTGEDVVVANHESKSILRAAAGQICREFAKAHYWPSYEMVAGRDSFEPDGRHVSQEGVEQIVEGFVEAFSAR